MSEVYIRTPDRDESRGPFTESKLASLAEAGQITENTLYYDEDKEEWLPIGLNADLKAAVFPEREKLSLKMAERRRRDDEDAGEAGGKEISVEQMLADAGGVSMETRHRQEANRSAQRAAALSIPATGTMMLLSVVFLVIPHIEIIRVAVEESAYSRMLHHPFVVLALFDLLMGVLLFLTVTEVFPLLRARAALTAGFGVYLAWALGDPTLIATFAGAGAGLFLATVTRRFPVMLLAVLLGLAGHGLLAYLSITGRFDGFFEAAAIGL
jgi:hypothetical protein